MELYQLRSLLEVVVTQNLTRAAANLHLSQYALSSQIKMDGCSLAPRKVVDAR